MPTSKRQRQQVEQHVVVVRGLNGEITKAQGLLEASVYCKEARSSAQHCHKQGEQRRGVRRLRADQEPVAQSDTSHTTVCGAEKGIEETQASAGSADQTCHTLGEKTPDTSERSRRYTVASGARSRGATCHSSAKENKLGNGGCWGQRCKENVPD